MAIDDQGNYYLDYEEEEIYKDEIKRQEIRGVVEAQRKAQQANQEVNRMWEDTLKEEGLDYQTYEQFYNQDPDLAKELMKSGMKSFASGIKRGRDAKGRFVPGKSVQQKRGQHEPSESADRVAEIKARAEKGGRLSSSDEEALIDDLFPSGL